MSTTSPTNTRPASTTHTRASTPSRTADAQRAHLATPQKAAPRATAGRFAEVLGRGAVSKGKPFTASAAGAAAQQGAQQGAQHGAPHASGPQPARPTTPRADDDARDMKSHPRLAHDDADRSLLAPFVPPPSVLAAPLSTTPIAAPAASNAPARAEAAALAERLVRSMRIGKVGRDGHEVRLRLDVGARSDVEVRLRHVDGALSATLVTDAASHADAERLASALRQELTDRGIVCENVDVAIG